MDDIDVSTYEANMLRKNWTCFVATRNKFAFFKKDDNWSDVRAYELGVRAWASEVERRS